MPIVMCQMYHVTNKLGPFFNSAQFAKKIVRDGNTI